MAFPDKKKIRRPKNKKTKKKLVFDKKDRTEYLTGFKKRKDERRKIAQEKFEQRKKEEKRELKKKLKEFHMRKVRYQRTVPEVQHLVDPETYELPDHTVTVTDISNVDLSGSCGLHLGQNKFENENEAEDSDANPKEQYANVSDKKLKKLKSKIKRKISNSGATKAKRLKGQQHGKRMKSKKEKQRIKVRKRG